MTVGERERLLEDVLRDAEAILEHFDPGGDGSAAVPMEFMAVVGLARKVAALRGAEAPRGSGSQGHSSEAGADAAPGGRATPSVESLPDGAGLVSAAREDVQEAVAAFHYAHMNRCVPSDDCNCMDIVGRLEAALAAVEAERPDVQTPFDAEWLEAEGD